MPKWTTHSPNDPCGQSLPLRRTPAGGSITGICTVDDLVGTKTHFYGGRTIPCEERDCKACLNGIGWRWHGYLAAIDTTKHVHFVFEMTAQASDSFVAYRKKYGTLRGCLFKAERIRNAPNARVVIQTKPADLTQFDLPKAPILSLVLCMIWGIPADNQVVDRKINNRPLLQVTTPDVNADAGNNHIHKERHASGRS